MLKEYKVLKEVKELKEDKEIKELSAQINVTEENIRERIDSLREFNPMLGFRGCRLGIVYPEISELQAKCIRAGRKTEEDGQRGGE